METREPSQQVGGALFQATLDIAAARRAAGQCDDRALHDPTYRLARLMMPGCW